MSENPEVTSDDRLWAALAYVFSPIVPIIILFLEDKKSRPFIRANNVQALIWGLIFTALGSTVVLSCLVPIGWIISLFWGYKTFQGEEVVIPVITDFVRNQGWA